MDEEVKVENEIENEIVENKINDLLDSCKDFNFSTVLILGLNDKNALEVLSSHPRYDFMQYLLNRAQFELSAHEMDTILKLREKK